MFRALAAASAFFLLIGAPGAAAQSQAQYEAVMRWAAGHQTIIQATIAPLGEMPEPYADGASPTERAAWVARARGWINGYRSTLDLARQRAAQLGPVPEGEGLAAIYVAQERALPELFDGLANFLTEYEAGVSAIERDDPQGTHIAAINAVDAQLLIQTQVRNVNALQAEAARDGPQKHLLRSFAASYDATIAVLRARRATYVGDDVSQASAAVVQAAADAIRQHSRIGRLAARTAEASLPASVPPDQSDFMRRVRLAYQSFDGSFDREDEVAVLLDEVARLLASGRAFSEEQPRMDQILSRIGEVDLERMGDIQRRTALVQRVTPPT
jgi:hypothetical protein